MQRPVNFFFLLESYCLFFFCQLVHMTRNHDGLTEFSSKITISSEILKLSHTLCHGNAGLKNKGLCMVYNKMRKNDIHFQTLRWLRITYIHWKMKKRERNNNKEEEEKKFKIRKRKCDKESVANYLVVTWPHYLSHDISQLNF